MTAEVLTLIGLASLVIVVLFGVLGYLVGTYEGADLD
jgi:hypothetical protein